MPCIIKFMRTYLLSFIYIFAFSECNLLVYNLSQSGSKYTDTEAIGAGNDSLNGKDLVKIKENGNNTESLLAGNYGEVMPINIPKF